MHIQIPENYKRYINFSPILNSDNDWARFGALPEYIKDKLSECPEKIEKISTYFNLEPRQASAISLAVRKFYLGDLHKESLSYYIANAIPIDATIAQRISDEIIQRIINDKTEENKYLAQIIKIKLNDAIKKYPELGEQLITSAHIKLKSFPEMVRPSVKNWISDYTFNTGYNKHDAIALGNYLYQNENSRSLGSSDRQKLAYILKAYDENAEVTVNERTKQIIFPITSKEQRPMNNAQRTMANEPRKVASLPRGEHEMPKDILFKPRVDAPIQSNQSGFFSNRQSNLTFSSPHKLPVESQNMKHEAWSMEHKIQNTNAGVGLKPVPQSSHFMDSIPQTPAPRINSYQAPIAKQPIITAPRPIALQEKAPETPQPLIISPTKRRLDRPVPDYNIVNLKK